MERGTTRAILLWDGLGQGLPFGRHPDINRGAHTLPPSGGNALVRARQPVRAVSSIAAGTDTSASIAALYPPLAGMADVSARGVAWLPVPLSCLSKTVGRETGVENGTADETSGVGPAMGGSGKIGHW
jgi:hypothetical protein